MNRLSARGFSGHGQNKGDQKANNRVPGESSAAKRRSGIKLRRFSVGGVKDLLSRCQAKKHPHAKKAKPAEKLNHRQLFHGDGHFLDGWRHVWSAQYPADGPANSRTSAHVQGGEVMVHQGAASYA